MLVVDNSASMNATDVFPTRLARAREEGVQAIDGLRFRDEMAVVAAGTEPQVVCGMTRHQRTLKDAVNALAPSDGPTRVADAVGLARRLIGDQPNGKVVVLSDGCFPDAEKLAQAPDVEWRGVGQRTGNVGITRFQVRRSLLDPIGYQVLAEVMNNSDEPVECRISIDLNSEPVDVVPLKLEPGKTWSQVFDKTAADGGRLVARLDKSDALMADNEAWALLPRREMQRVTLIAEPNQFLEKVFEANPLVELTVLKKLATVKQKAGTVTVFHRQVPERLPDGPVLVIDPAASCDLWKVGEKLANPIVTKQDKDSPLMAHVKLDNVLMPEARQLTLEHEPHLLAAALGGEPLYCEIDRSAGKVLVLTVNIDQGDLPLRTAFPILMTNALSYFAGHSGELRESLPTGAITEIDIPGAVPADAPPAPTNGTQYPVLSTPHSTFSLFHPSGDPRPLPANVAKTTVGPLDHCGIWKVGLSATDPEKPPPPVLEIACNLANRAESDLRPPESLVTKPSPALAGFGVRPVWYYLLAAAWLLSAAEWYLYQRRWIS